MYVLNSKLGTGILFGNETSTSGINRSLKGLYKTKGMPYTKDKSEKVLLPSFFFLKENLL